MPRTIGINDLNYYAPRTDINGPAMTDAIHSIAAAALDAPGCSAYTYMLRSYQPFVREPYLQFSEFAPVMLSATAYDFLTGVGGFMQEFLYGFSGYRPLPNAVRIDPSLPPQLAGLTLRGLAWQGRTFSMRISPHETRITLDSGAPLPILTPGGAKTVARGAALIIPTRRSDLQPTDDLARCRQVTASSSLAGSPPTAAIDGTPATSWVAAEARATLTVNLAASVLLRKITVVRGSRESFSYFVQVSSDGLEWKTVATAPAASTGTDEFSVSPVQARYLRLDFHGMGDAKPPSIAEVIVRSTAH